MASTAPRTYSIPEIADPAFAPFRLMAGGDVASAARAYGEHLLRAVADFPPESVSVTLRFSFCPGDGTSDPQRRLNISLSGWSRDDEGDLGLTLLLERGPLRRFYDLRRTEEAPQAESFGVSCDVVRRQDILDPTVSREFNAKVPPAYYRIRPFEPREENDYLLLDAILARVQEPVLIELRLEPADIRRELAAHTKYLSGLQQVFRSWDHDDDEAGGWGLQGGTGSGRGGSQANLRLLRQRDPLAEEIHRHQQRFHDTLTAPHLRFHIRVFAETAAVARLLASVVAESTFEEGSYQLFDSAAGDRFFDTALDAHRQQRVLPAPVLQKLIGQRQLGMYEALSALSNLAPVDQLVSAFRLPLASYGSPCCIRKNTDPHHDDVNDMITVGKDEAISSADGERDALGVHRGVTVRGLAKHWFISGVPGSGKTTAVENLLIQLHDRRIPFLVLEPAKSEYRSLKCLRDSPDARAGALAEDLKFYTPGDEAVSPLRVNPLAVPPGALPDEHIESLLNCFKAAMPMPGPMPALLSEALERVYENCSSPEEPPRMADLHLTARDVLAEKGYSGDVDSDLRAALEVRLGLLTRRSVGRVFQCSQNVPDAGELMVGHSIIELAALPPEQACLMSLFILTLIRGRLKMLPYPKEGGIRLVIVIEEAHNIVGRNRDAVASEDATDPKAFASEFVCRMLAELRALGVGIVIVDQLPSAVAPEVIKNTSTKLAFRQVASDDREDLGSTMLFGPIETEEIARLRPGEAYFYTERYHGPRRVRTPDLHTALQLPEPPLGRAILPHIVGDGWFSDAQRARRWAELQRLLHEMDRFDASRVAILRRATQLRADVARHQIHASGNPDRVRIGGFLRRARSLRQELQRGYVVFTRDVYRPLLGPDGDGSSGDDGLSEFRTHLRERFESVIRTDIESFMAWIDRSITGWSSL